MPANQKRLKRFTVTHRLWHLLLIILFMTLGLTGLAWMYIETAWGQLLAAPFGGYQGALDWHRIAGLFFLAGFAFHLIYLLARIDWKRFPRSLLGPDTLVFQWVDIKGFFQHFLWIFGLAKAPRFDRWSWWEKFDYWAVWWGLVIVGITGLMLYNPVLSSDYIPGWLLNIALWVHRIEAVRRRVSSCIAVCRRMSSYFIVCRRISSYVVVCRRISSYFVVCRRMSSYVVVCRRMSSYVVVCRRLLSYIVVCRRMSSFVFVYRSLSSYAVVCRRVTSCVSV